MILTKVAHLQVKDPHGLEGIFGRLDLKWTGLVIRDPSKGVEEVRLSTFYFLTTIDYAL